MFIYSCQGQNEDQSEKGETVKWRSENVDKLEKELIEAIFR